MFNLNNNHFVSQVFYNKFIQVSKVQTLRNEETQTVNTYKVSFVGTNGEANVIVESNINYLDEETSNIIIDQGIEIGYQIHGADFRDRLDTYSITAMPV